MRTRFDEELKQVRAEFIDMAALADKALALCIGAMEDKAYEELIKVKHIDNEVAQYERIIERRCLLLLLYQQPVATDLRMVSSLMKMIRDIRHLSDQADAVAHLISANKEKINYGEISQLVEMGKMVQAMAYDAVHAFSLRDEKLARRVIARDDMVDEAFLKVKKLFIKGLKNDSFKAGAAVDGLMISKYFEKIGDYAVEVAAWTIFMITAVPVEEQGL